MKAIQLNLFEVPEIESNLHDWLSYFQRNFNWYPKVNEEAKIFSTFAFNDMQQRDMYVSGMVVKVLWMNSIDAIVEPTDRYIELCKDAKCELKKEQYRVKLISLGKNLG